MPDGLLQRIVSAAKSESDIDALVEKVKTKKYTNAAIKRAVIFSLLSTSVESVKSVPLFTRFMGANERGREALSSVEFPVITRAADIKKLSDAAKIQLETVKKADMLYSLCDDNEKSFGPVII